jgi:hypothetical protein
MSALYVMRYEGVAGVGHGAVFIGKGKILGVDIKGAKYEGTYSSKNGGLSGAATLTSAGGELVTGEAVPAGTKVQIVFDLAANQANGEFQLRIGGQPVRVLLAKIGDVP